tara:strand:+ start:924 stop:1628 length:705 start_codon:yes stop_codon:yes gene_type:complete
MRRAPRNLYVRNCKISEMTFVFIVQAWWNAYSATRTQALITEQFLDEYKTEKQKQRQHPVSRETISKLFNEIGEQLWLTKICHSKVIQLVTEEGMGGDEALRQIFEEQNLYYSLIKTESEPKKIQVIRKKLGHTWSVFADRPIGHLWHWFKQSRGYTREKFDGYVARAILLEQFLKPGVSKENAVYEATEFTLELLMFHPLRSPLPIDGMPWLDSWKALNAAGPTATETQLWLP